MSQCHSLFISIFISVTVQFSQISHVESYRVFNALDNMHFTPEQQQQQKKGWWLFLFFFF